MVEKDASESSILELITYEECGENCTLLKEPDILHQLLSCELEASPIFEAAMIDLPLLLNYLKVIIFMLISN